LFDISNRIGYKRALYRINLYKKGHWTMNHNKDQMHPEDMRNMILFFAIALALYFGYTTFISTPQKEALERHRIAQEKVQIQQAKNSTLAIQARDTVLKSSNNRLFIKNKEITGSLSLKGARFDDISFNNHFETNEKKATIKLLSPRMSEYPRYVDYGWVSSDKNLKVPDENSVWSITGNSTLSADQSVTIFWENDSGLRFERTIALDDHFMFTITQNVRNRSGKNVTLYPYALISQTGLPMGLQGSWIMHEGPMGYIGEELIELKYKTLKKERQVTYQATKGWTGITDKYWLTSLIPAEGKNTKYRYHYIHGPVVTNGMPDRPRYQVDMMGQAAHIPHGMSATVTHDD